MFFFLHLPQLCSLARLRRGLGVFGVVTIALIRVDVVKDVLREVITSVDLVEDAVVAVRRGVEGIRIVK